MVAVPETEGADTDVDAVITEVNVFVTEASDEEEAVAAPELDDTTVVGDTESVSDVAAAEELDELVEPEADEDASVPWIVKVGLMLPLSPNKTTM